MNKTSNVRGNLSTYALLLMLFFGQAFASQLSCCESINLLWSTNIPHTHDNQQNDEHAIQHSDMSHDMSQDMSNQCCDQNCDCPLGACASFAVLCEFSHQVLEIHSAKVLLVLASHPDPFHASLNKPPIFS